MTFETDSKLDSYQTFIAPTKPMLGSISHELRDNEAQLFTALACEFTLIDKDLASRLSRPLRRALDSSVAVSESPGHIYK
jgi:hypothetical protein